MPNLTEWDKAYMNRRVLSVEKEKECTDYDKIYFKELKILGLVHVVVCVSYGLLIWFTQ